MIRKHPVHGEEILKPILTLKEESRIVRHHHEREDGSGYLHKQGDEIPEAAKVLARTHNGFSQEANINGLSALRAKGMDVYKPTMEEQAQFRALALKAGDPAIQALDADRRRQVRKHDAFLAGAGDHLSRILVDAEAVDVCIVRHG